MISNKEFQPRRKKAVEHRRPLILDEIEYMLIAGLRHERAFTTAVAELKPEHFTAGELPHKIVWASALDFYKEHKRRPDRRQLALVAKGKLAGDPDVSDDDAEKTFQLIKMAHAALEVDFDADLGLSFLRKFLAERLADDLRLTIENPALVPTDLYRLAVSFRDRAAAIASVGAKIEAIPFPDDWTLEQAPLEVVPTGIPFIDEPLDGGHAPGEVALYLGCYGSGKSLLAIQLSIAAAGVFWSRWVAEGRKGPLPLSYLVSYEDSKKEIQLRALAHKAQIPFHRLMLGQRDPTQLSTFDNLQPYELARYKDELALGNRVSGERDRLQDAIAILNRNWRILDMTGSSGESGVGSRLHAEVLGCIRTDLAGGINGVEATAGSIVLDYVGAAVKRYMDAAGESRDNMRHFINEFPYHFKHQILEPLGACGHLFHQMDTKSNATAPGKVLSHSDAAEGKGIGENANFCFAVGKATQEGLLVWNNSKARRTKKSAPRILQMDGACMTMRDTGTLYVLDTRSSKIVLASDAGRMADTDGIIVPDELAGGDDVNSAYGAMSSDDY